MTQEQSDKAGRYVLTPKVRERVRVALEKAIAATAERNKARRLPDDFLNRRITI